MAGLVEINDIPVDGVEEEAVMEELLADESFLQDEGEEEEEEELVTVTKKKGRRGADLAWEEYDFYETKEEYDASVIPNMLATLFTRRSGKQGDRQTYGCKFARKKGFLCKSKFRVTYSDSSEAVTVEAVTPTHNHEINLEAEEAEDGNLVWTAEQKKVIMTGVLNEAKPAVIRRNLKDYFPEGKLPTATQLANKIAYVRKELVEAKQVLTTGELRKLIAEHSNRDEHDKHKMYVGFSEVVDDQGEANVRFTVVLTTPALAARMSKELIQDDSTYRYFYHFLFYVLPSLLSLQAPVAGLPHPDLRQVLLHRALLPDPRHPAVEGGHQGLQQHLQVRQGHPGRGAQGEDG